MSQYKPRQRAVPAAVLTTAGFLEAEFHVLENGTLLEQLDAVEEFYTVTNASLVGIETEVPFLALQRDAIVFVAPRDEQQELLAAPVSNAQTDRLFVLFDGGVISGDMSWREGVRLSDFVKKQTGYILLRDCQIVLGHLLADAKQMRRADALIVNVNHVVGISESAPI